MCRLSLISGLNAELARKLLVAFKEASRRDEYLREISERGSSSHDDGWGYALIGEAGDLSVSSYYRSCKPVFEDGEFSKLGAALRSFKSFHLIVHSRKASKGKRELRNTHPFHYAHLGFDYWFAHNGTVNDAEISSNMGWKYDESLSDSHYLGRFFYECLDRDFDEISFSETFKRAQNYVKENSALNTVSIFSGRGVLKSIATCFYESRSEAYEKYYKLYLHEGSGLKAAVSSTLLLYLKGNEFEFNEMENGSYVIFEL